MLATTERKDAERIKRLNSILEFSHRISRISCVLGAFLRHELDRNLRLRLRLILERFEETMPSVGSINDLIEKPVWLSAISPGEALIVMLKQHVSQRTTSTIKLHPEQRWITLDFATFLRSFESHLNGISTSPAFASDSLDQCSHFSRFLRQTLQRKTTVHNLKLG